MQCGYGGERGAGSGARRVARRRVARRRVARRRVVRRRAGRVICYYSPGECYVTAGWETGLPRATCCRIVSRERLPAGEFDPRTARTDGYCADPRAVSTEGDA